MTYRDDHDAALARADALEDELARSERERARLASELARERAGQPPRPVATPAIIMVLVGVLLILGVAAGIVVALATRG